MGEVPLYAEVVSRSCRCNSYVTNKMGDLECRREAEKSKVKSDLGGSSNAERDGLGGGGKDGDLRDGDLEEEVPGGRGAR